MTSIHYAALRITLNRINASKKVDAIMKTAIECGINFFDHADIYGKGNAEKVFG